MTEDRRQKSEVRDQRSDDRGQMTDDRISDCGLRIAELKTNDLNGFNGLNVLRSNNAMRSALSAMRRTDGP
jgi:hypothetical protein